MKTQPFVVGLVVVPVCLLGVTASTGVATAADEPGCATPRAVDYLSSNQDINGDAYSDVVVGVPSAASGGRSRAGVVDIHYPFVTDGLAVQRLGESSFGTTPAAGDRFGTSVALTQLQLDRPRTCADLVIGAPGAAGGTGAVTVARGSNAGVRTSDAVQLTGRKPGDHFGASVAASGRNVWVGAPDQTVAGRRAAGAVYHFFVRDDGSLRFVQALSEDTPGVPGTAEAGDRFGSVLSATDVGLAVGEPGEDGGRLHDSGAVTVIATVPQTGALGSATKVSPNTPGVAGVSHAGDRYGAGVSLTPSFLVVGAPGAHRRGRAAAGLVQTFLVDGRVGVRRPVRFASTVTQESATIPGASEVGDQFGASVLVGNDNQLWIGVPGESLGGRVGAGEVVRARLGFRTALARANGTVIRAGGAGSNNMPGAPQAGAHVGSSLSLESVSPEGDTYAGGEGVVVAVPGFNGPASRSGEIWVATTFPDVYGHGIYTDSSGPVAHEHYGSPASVSSNGGYVDS